jgi:polyhydroxybutyrate depolymerase
LSRKIGKKFSVLAVVVYLAFSVAAHAKSGLVKHTTTWQGLRRYYAVYTPRTLAARPSLVLYLNSTSASPATEPPYFGLPPWEALAEQYGFVMVWPVSSYNSAHALWYWDCYETDTTFPINPDDSGFLRWLITSLQGQFAIGTGNTFVTGMSSGGFMAHRVATDLSDIVAAIAPVSGMIDIHPIGVNFLPPDPTNPISVYELHGDEDTEVPYCGGTGWFWGGLHDSLASVDDSVNFWISANSCTHRSMTQPLCTNGQPTAGVNRQDATGCNDGVEVVFEREKNVGHVWLRGTEAKVWAFFQTHARH